MNKNLSVPQSSFRLLPGLCFLLALSSLGACADRENLSPLPSIDPSIKADLAAPVDCRTAKQDIATLEEEKASVAKQLLSGVRSLMPIAAVAGILMGDYRDRVQVATGQYNADIEAKIAQIKKTCQK